MKKLSLVFQVMLMALLGLSAAAANVEIRPNPALVHQSLSEITVKYLDATYGIADQVDVSGITLTRKGSTEVLYALPDPAVSYSTLTLKFGYKGDTEASAVTTEGVYTLYIPDGAVKTFDTLSNLGAVDIEFNVSPNSTHAMSRYLLTPDAGQVDEITTVAINFPDAGDLDFMHNNLGGNGDFSAITLTLKSDPTVRYTAVKTKFNWFDTVTFAFRAEGATDNATITADGTYVLDIPAGIFQQDRTGISNDHITAEYVIGSPVAPEFAGMTSSPADGSSVGRFRDLVLTFPEMADGLAYPIPDIARITLTTPSAETFYGFSPRVGSAPGGNYNRLTLSFAPQGAVTVDATRVFTEAGVYTVNIPAGILHVEGKDVTNSEMTLTFTVDPMLDFQYTVTPAADVCHQQFGPVTIGCGSNLKSLALNPECTERATISLGSTNYTLTAAADGETAVTFSVPADATATPGEWTVRIPAGFLNGVNQSGTTVPNPSEITSAYIIKEPQRFDFTVDPKEGATVEFFKNVTVEFAGSALKQVNLNPEAGTPTLAGADNVKHDLAARQSGRYVMFELATGTALADGAYTVDVPAGYLVTIDSDGLEAKVGAISTTFSIEKKTVADYTDGILFLNDGWFGHDTGSLNFLGNDGEWTYDVFARNNPDRRLGVTSQYGQCFGDRIYVVSKQSEGDAPTDGGVLTVMDAATMRFVAQINNLPDARTEPRAFCAWDTHKGYLSTKGRIYSVDLDKMEVGDVVPGTDVYTSFDSNGEMLRYGNHVLVIRESTGVDAIDPATDEVVKIPAELAVGFAVTPDGGLYVATRDESEEFVRISPYDLTVEETYDIPADRAKIANVWTTWRKPSLTADLKANAVYYVTQKAADESPAGVRTVARYDFDTKEFNEAFITLPGVTDGEAADWVLYGEGVSVDPATGNILLTAVEAGYGSHYSKNRVFVADPVTGDILAGRTHVLDDAYWFPAMTLYPDFDAPVIDTEGYALPEQEGTFTLDLAGMTSLPVGNIHLVNYSARSLDEDMCAVEPTDEPGVFELTVAAAEGAFSVELSADYQGKTATVTIGRGAGIGSTGIDALPEICDVYNLQGICVRRNATREAIRTLPAGIYVAAGRKFAVR